MRYILNDGYRLRGWYKNPTGLLVADKHEAAFLTREKYLFLLRCDGAHEIEPETLDRKEKEFLDKLIGRNIVRPARFWEVLKPEQVYRTYPARYIKSVHWSVTGACNLKCRHCFMSAPQAKHGSPSHEEIMRIADQLAECGVCKADITGGEPLIRKDFLDILDALLERDIGIGTIFTNGWLVDGTLLDKLAERKIRAAFQLSFDGVGWHDFLRGVPGAEERTLNAIRLLREREFPVAVSMCVHRKNRHTVRETVRLLASMGVSSVKLGAMEQEGEWARPEVMELQLTPAEEQALFEEYIPRYFEDNAPLSVMLGGSFVYTPGYPEWYVFYEKKCSAEEENDVLACGVLGNSIYIGADGTVAPCMGMCEYEQPGFANLKETPLREILRESALMRLCHATVGDVRNGNDQCRNCEYMELCNGGCRSKALANGNYFGVNPDACEFFRNGWYERIHEIAQPAFEAYIRRCPPRTDGRLPDEKDSSECP